MICYSCPCHGHGCCSEGLQTDAVTRLVAELGDTVGVTEGGATLRVRQCLILYRICGRFLHMSRCRYRSQSNAHVFRMTDDCSLDLVRLARPVLHLDSKF